MIKRKRNKRVFKYRGEDWTMLQTERPKSGDWGTSDPNNRVIWISAIQPSTTHELETILHELAHAGQYDLSEAAVNDLSAGQAECLVRAGYYRAFGFSLAGSDGQTQ